VNNKQEHIRRELIRELRENNVLWSYESPDYSGMPDSLLIEKVLVHSDLDNIFQLFILFPGEEIFNIWKSRLLKDETLRSLNILYAFLLFNISDPETYVKEYSGYKE